MPFHRTRQWCRGIALLFGGVLLAQEETDPPPPPPAPWRLRIVGEHDQQPRPGVLLHVQPGPSSPPTAGPDGYLVVEAPQIHRLRAAQTFRSGPDGAAELPAAIEREPWRVFAGEPHSLLGKPERIGDEIVWRVAERAPVGVRVFDADRKPVDRLPVALQSGGRELSYALTDRQGRALLGVPADHTARLYLAPAGWVGPLDGLPTVVVDRSGRRGGDLVLPAFGTLRLRAMRGGQPARVPLGLYALRFPDEPTWLVQGAALGQPQGIGFAFPYTAVGVRLSGHVDLGGTAMVDCVGPDAAGGERVVDHEVPWRPALRATSSGPPVARVPRTVHVTLVTDAGAQEMMVGLQANGTLELGSVSLRGRRLLRVSLDVPAKAATKPEAWSATRACDHDLGQATIDLGAMPMSAVIPLRGRVVDAAGKGVAHASIDVQPQPDGARSTLVADADGWFVWPSAIPRGADGVAVPIRAQARRSGARSEAALFAGGDALTLVLGEPPERAASRPARVARGTATVVLGAHPQAAEFAARLTMTSTLGFVRTMPAVQPQPGGAFRIVFERLEAGVYTLYTTDESGRARLLLHRLDVPAEGPCTDPRLLQLRLGEGPATRTIQVVDGDGVPIAGATVRGPGFALSTDGNGRVQVATYDPKPLPGSIEARGLRPIEVADLADGLVVRPPTASQTRIVVVGIPADLPIGRIGIWLRHEDLARFAGPRAGLAADGTVAVATPVAGNYVLSLVAVAPGEVVGEASRWSGVTTRAGTIAIGAEPPAEIRWELDAEAVERLRAHLARE